MKERVYLELSRMFEAHIFDPSEFNTSKLYIYAAIRVPEANIKAVCDAINDLRQKYMTSSEKREIELMKKLEQKDQIFKELY